MRPLLIVGQHNKAFIPLLVKATMTNKVKDVPRCLAGAHDTLEITPGLPFQPSQLDQTALLHGMGNPCRGARAMRAAWRFRGSGMPEDAGVLFPAVQGVVWC